MNRCNILLGFVKNARLIFTTFYTRKSKRGCFIVIVGNNVER